MRPALLPMAAAAAAAVALFGCQKAATTPAATAPAAVAPSPTAAPAAASAAVPTTSANMPKLRVACAADIQKFCPGGDKPGKCLKQHKDELSATCSAARAARQAARKAGGKGQE